MQVSPSSTPFPAARCSAGRSRPGLPLGPAALVLAAALAAPSAAFAHALLTAPKPRDNRDDHKDNNGGAPCGIARATTQPTTNPPLTPGAPFTVTWNETVNHPGCFVIDFSMANDASFQVLSTVAHKTTGSTPRMYSQMVTLPSAPCAACTLRVRQIMLNAEPAAGAACPPANLAANSTYYTCANVVLGGGDGGVPDGGGTATGGGGGGGGSATGGRAGTGGVTATGGGNGAGSGGSTNSGSGGGGVFSGGAPGSGGSGVSSGGAPGSGGAANPGSGGASNPGTGGAGAGETPADPPPCACGVTNARTLSISGLLFAAMVAMTLGRGRARRRSAFKRKTNHNQ